MIDELHLLATMTEGTPTGICQEDPMKLDAKEQEGGYGTPEEVADEEMDDNAMIELGAMRLVYDQMWDKGSDSESSSPDEWELFRTHYTRTGRGRL